MLPVITYLSLTIPGVDGGARKLDTPSEVPTGGLEPGGTGEQVLQNSIGILLVSVTALSLIFLIWGGIKWITASGDKAKLDSAKKTLLYAIIGLVLAFASFFIVITVGTIIGVQLLPNPISCRAGLGSC